MANYPPKDVKIGAFSYELHFDRARMDRMQAEQKESCWGYSDHQHLTIGVEPNLIEARKRSTFIHELGHCFLESSGIGHPKEVDWETTLDVFAHAWLAFLRENPKAVRWLSDLDAAETGEDANESLEVEQVEVPNDRYLISIPAKAIDLLANVDDLSVYTTPAGYIYIPKESPSNEA